MSPIEQQFFNDLEKKLWTAADKLRSSLDASVSQIITATMEQGLVKSDPNAPESRRYARYIPAWA